MQFSCKRISLFLLVALSLLAVSSFAQPFIPMYSSGVVPLTLGANSIDINVSDVMTVNRVRIRINAGFATDEDLQFLQLSHAGPVLISSFVNAGSNFTNTIFDDNASTPFFAGSAPFNGSYLPESALATFNGDVSNGTWTLAFNNVGPNTGLIVWDLELNNIILPVEMTSFTAAGGDGFVNLRWHTETETNNGHYNLYRSTTQSDRGTLVAQIDGNGTTVTPHNYSFRDTRVVNGTHYYYHIADVDVDGREEMQSMVVSAIPSQLAAGEIPGNYALSQNFPNPFNPTTNFSYALPEAGNVQLTVVDLMGRTVAKLVNGYQAANSYHIQFNGSALPSGTYFYRLETSDFTSTKKMTLTK